MKPQENEHHYFPLVVIFMLFAILHQNQHKIIAFIYSIKLYLFLGAFLIVLWAVLHLWQMPWRKEKRQKGDILVGESKETPVYLSQEARTTHTQILGSTGTGKTESVVLPWIIQDIKQGAGVLIIDGKSDASFLNKLYAYTVRYRRKKDFKLFSLANIENSYSFNPLKGESSLEVSERVFNAFSFESEYYKNVQYKIFKSLVTLIGQKKAPTFKEIHRAMHEKTFFERLINLNSPQKIYTT